MKIFMILIILAVTGYQHIKPITLPLNEIDVKKLMAEQLDIADGWTFSKSGYTYSFSSHPTEPNTDGITYEINSKTGTVYDSTSGLPQANLVIKGSPNLLYISNGTIYIKRITDLARVILDKNNLKPANGDWISGGYGDGYLYGDVIQKNRTFAIKIEIFAGDWEEIVDPFAEPDTHSSYYGNWTVTRVVGSTPISTDADESLIGTKVNYSHKSASFGKDSVTNPAYRETVLSESAFIDEYRNEFKDIGISTETVSIIQIVNWTNTGDSFIIKNDQTMLFLWNGNYYEMKRDA